MAVRSTATRAYREAIAPLAVSAAGGLLAGLFLGGMRVELRAVDGLLVLVPALLATRGNVYGSFGARLASGLHQGLVEPRIDWRDERLRAGVAAALLTGLLASAWGAVAAVTALTWLGLPAAPVEVLVAIAVLAGLLSGAILTFAVVSVAVVGFRRGVNPDTVVGPIVTTTGDLFGVAFLLIAARIVLGVV